MTVTCERCKDLEAQLESAAQRATDNYVKYKQLLLTEDPGFIDLVRRGLEEENKRLEQELAELKSRL